MQIPRMTNNKRLLGLIFGLFIFTSAVAQKAAYNPYTQLGIGLPVYNPVTAMTSIGGGYNAIRSNLYINYLNPASYTSDSLMHFQFGFEVQSLSATRGGNTRKADLAFFNQLSLQLPIWKDKHHIQRLGMAFGYAPHTNVGYSFSDNERFINSPDTVDVTYTYEGSGGVDRFFVGFGGQPARGLNIGFNTYFYLGNIDKTKTSYFPSSFQSTNIQSITNTRIADFGFDFGAQYVVSFKDNSDLKILKKDRKDKFRLTFGATYALGKKMAAKNTVVARYFAGSLADQFYDQDTLAAKQKVKLQFPSSFGAGISFGQPDLWQINADFNATMWSQFRYANGTSEPLFGNSYNVSLGGEIKPNGKNTKSLFNQMTYRIGGRYGQSFLRPGGLPFQEAAISFGLGIPIFKNDLIPNRKISSSLNVGLEYGVTMPGSSIYTKEQMVRVVFSFNLRNRWFETYKYR